MYNDTENAYKHFVLYVDSYDNQPYWKEYEIKTYIHDMLYGLGVSLEPKEYEFATGYEKWLRDLRNIIDKELAKYDTPCIP